MYSSPLASKLMSPKSCNQSVSYENACVSSCTLPLAKNVAICGKTDCTGTNPVVKDLTPANIQITPEYLPGGEGNPITVKVSVIDYNFQPLFNLGALLGNNTFSLALPIRPSTTMYYMWTEPAGGEEG